MNMETFSIQEECFYFINPGELHSIEPRTRGKEFAVLFHPCILGFESCDRAQTGLMQLLLQGSMGFPRCLDRAIPRFLTGCVGKIWKFFALFTKMLTLSAGR